MTVAKGDWRKTVLATLALSVAGAGLSSAAVPYVVDSGWANVFMAVDVPGHMGGWGGGEDDPYTFEITQQSVLSVTDYYLAGDYFRIWNDNDLLLETPEVPVEPDLWTDNPNFAYAQPEWSSAWIVLDPGSYSLYFQDLLMADGNPPDLYEVADGAFRVDTGVTPIPEPGTVALLGLGLVATGFGLRRRLRG